MMDRKRSGWHTGVWLHVRAGVRQALTTRTRFPSTDFTAHYYPTRRVHSRRILTAAQQCLKLQRTLQIRKQSVLVQEATRHKRKKTCGKDLRFEALLQTAFIWRNKTPTQARPVL